MVNRSRLVKLCNNECNKIITAARGLLLSVSRAKLRSLATGAFLGGQDEIWKEVWSDELGQQFGRAQVKLAHIVKDTQPAQYCSRTRRGPLYIPIMIPHVTYPRTFYHQKEHTTADLRHCLHYDGSEAFYPPLILAGKSRWDFTLADIDDPEEQTTVGWNMVAEMVRRWIGDRAEYLTRIDEEDKPTLPDTPYLDLDIYVPRAMLRPDTKETMLELLGQIRETQLATSNTSESQSGKDVIRWHKLEDAPKCEGCGSLPTIFR